MSNNNNNKTTVSPTIISKIEFINDHFKLPITFLKDELNELRENIVNDLELVKNIDPSNCSPIYHFAFQPKTKCGMKVLEQTAKYYTTDLVFLKDNQELLKTFLKEEKNDKNDKNDKNEPNETIKTDISPHLTQMIELWDEIKNDTGFKEKYYYVDWTYWEYLNKSENFLQLMSMYNLASPVISLLIPIVILIIPFFIIKSRGVEITMKEYIEVLKIIGSNHAIGKVFTQFNHVSSEQKIYLIMSAVFYLFSIYQNIHTCIRFHSNMHKIYKSLKNVKEYLTHTLNAMSRFLSITENLNTFVRFNSNVKEHMIVLKKYQEKLNNITGEKLSIINIKEIGYLLKYFYELYDDKEYNESFMFSFGFHGYMDNLEGLSQNIKDKKIAFAKFSKKTSKAHITSKGEKGNKSKKSDKKSKFGFKQAYYATLINDPKQIKNDLSLEQNITITGPNASGKTTVLKTTLINIILSQQFGCGFYKSANLVPYNHIHCYLNIPDTAGRDSLFQAEARRCKEIIDAIQNNKKETHFCVFDELYSGTNPDEAVMSALGFMEYLVKFPNVKCLLTTHFIDVCKLLDEREMVKNFHMKTIKKGEDGNDFTYTYLLKKGISEVRGGIKVLQDLNYPQEILTRGKNNILRPQ